MRVPYSWLRELVPDAPAAADTAELLTSIGLSVEALHERPGAPDGVVVVDVTSVTPVEGSDHLLLAVVSDGTREHRVVTGAPNARAGLRTALAPAGTYLPELDVTVEEREMAGVPSEGMLLSPKEAGLFEYAGGLLVLGDDAPLGAALAELWPAETVIELELTPNRADAFGMLGVARDLAAKLGTTYRHPAAHVTPADPGVDNGLRVRVDDAAACPRFTLTRIDGVRVAPSPLWLQRRLAALELRPRNAIVDVTNYVTFELGQPSHAFDRSRLGDDTLVVRRARPGERITTLTEEDLELDPADLLITTPRDAGPDETEPVGLAGVIGGLDSSVTSGTTAVALEVAHFDPVVIRKTAKRHALSTDAHYRFERGVDPNLPPLAAARAAALIAELTGGTVAPGVAQHGGDTPLRTVAFRPSRVEFLTALHVPAATQRQYLEALGMHVEDHGDDTWRVTAPSWRFDVAIEEDLIEEVARLHGYADIPSTLPTMDFVPERNDVTHRALRDRLAAMGFQEIITYVFSSDDDLERARAPQATVRLASAPSAERSVLRTALHPSLLRAASANRAETSLLLFEIGRAFHGDETERLALLARGTHLDGVWRPGAPLDFYAFKGHLEALAHAQGAELTLEPLERPADDAPHLHPGVAARVLWNGQPAGNAGRLHPEVARAYELGETFLAELTLPLEPGAIRYREFPRQPFAERDLAVVAPADVPYAALVRIVQGAAGERLESVAPFDVYTGAPVPEGMRSVALRLRYRDPERALRDAEVDESIKNVTSALRNDGYSIRDE